MSLSVDQADVKYAVITRYASRTRRHIMGILYTLMSLVSLVSCGIAPDAQSGGDMRRDVARELPLDEWVTDDDGIDYAAGDKTDWKKVVIPRNGTLFLEVAVDEKAATVDVGLFDRYGRLLLSKTRPSGTTEHVLFEGEVTQGNYFVRISARKSEDKSVYSIRASMQGGYGVGDIPRPE
ncbi:MAG: hypothetical protein VX223_08100 [Myxococcota bacterium]|nr:hypothetical protein [Myxococcota bacterium]